ncbi:MAG: hypothetical protein LUF00_00165 [Lachnospiraceae bacterium]|nr:hypothetical protein [Lachnospiraceae bacterium]
MAVFISEYFELDLEAMGVFDAVMDTDSNYFINVTRLKDATTPEFIGTYDKINEYFNQIAVLLDAAESADENDKFYKSAIKKFSFSEVNGINLGFSTTQHGAAFGPILSNAVISDAFKIIKAGTKNPEIFHLVGLFEDNVGPDRLSDMFATIIKKNIYDYTRRINQEASITPENFPDEQFKDGIVFNSYKGCDLLFLPKEILHELPIARCWDDIDRVVRENEVIRKEINELVGEEWRKYSTSQKKAYIREHIFENPIRCQRIIESYRDSHEKDCDWEADQNYLAEYVFRDLRKKMGFGFLQHSDNQPEITSREAMLQVCDIFKNWVENNRGWDNIQRASKRNGEKLVQRLFHLSAVYFVKVNNLDLNFESNLGRGPVDIKISRGNDKSICEIKLSSNEQYLHGYEVQIEEYGKAECTDNLFYVFIDVGNPVRRDRITKKHEENIKAGKRCPELIIIDANEKNQQASTELLAVQSMAC